MPLIQLLIQWQIENFASLPFGWFVPEETREELKILLAHQVLHTHRHPVWKISHVSFEATFKPYKYDLKFLDQRPSHYISSLNSSLNHLNKDKDESSSMSHQSHPESMDSFTTTNTTSISNHPKEGASTPMFKHSNNVFYNQSAFQEMLS